jgi:hypothetical protein
VLRHHRNGTLHSHFNVHHIFESSDHTIAMVRTKRGGGFKKAGGFAKKRSSPDDDDVDDSAPRASKKSKGDEEDESLPVVPELKTDTEGNAYIGVSFGKLQRGGEDRLTAGQLNTSGKRRVTVQDYNKSTLITIREYYITDAGETKPGKKACVFYVLISFPA